MLTARESGEPGPTLFLHVAPLNLRTYTFPDVCDRFRLPDDTVLDYSAVYSEVNLTLSSPYLGASLNVLYASRHDMLDYPLPGDDDDFERLLEVGNSMHAVELRWTRWLLLRYGRFAADSDIGGERPSESDRVLLGVASPALGLAVNAIWVGRDGQTQLETFLAGVERAHLIKKIPLALSLQVAYLRDADQLYGVTALDWILLAEKDTRLRLEIAPELNALQMRYAQLGGSTGSLLDFGPVYTEYNSVVSLSTELHGAVSLFSGRTLGEVTPDEHAFGWSVGFRQHAGLGRYLGWYVDFVVGVNRPSTLNVLPHLAGATELVGTMGLKLAL